MHHKHVFSEIHNENCFSTQRPTEALYLTVNKKLRHSYNQFGLTVVLYKLEHDTTYETLTNKIFPNQLQTLVTSHHFGMRKEQKNWHLELHVSTFPTFQTKCTLFFGLAH